VAIASTTSPENIEPLITAGFGRQAMSWFATIAAGDVVANKKPAPDIYNVALKSLGVHPARAIAMEDSAIGVTSAKAAACSPWPRRTCGLRLRTSPRLTCCCPL